MAGNFEGDGAYTEADGRSYRGQWKGDQMEGDAVHTWASGSVYRGQWKGGLKDGDGVVTFADGRRICGRWVGDKEVSSVPFDAANPAHAAVLRAANEAEARRVNTPHRHRARSAHWLRGAGSGERRRHTGESCGGARCAARA
jgi:hypothetical protein